MRTLFMRHKAAYDGCITIPLARRNSQAIALPSARAAFYSARETRCRNGEMLHSVQHIPYAA